MENLRAGSSSRRVEDPEWPKSPYQTRSRGTVVEAPLSTSIPAMEDPQGSGLRSPVPLLQPMPSFPCLGNS